MLTQRACAGPFRLSGEVQRTDDAVFHSNLTFLESELTISLSDIFGPDVQSFQDCSVYLNAQDLQGLLSGEEVPNGFHAEATKLCCANSQNELARKQLVKTALHASTENEFYYRNNDPGVPQRLGPWTEVSVLVTCCCCCCCFFFFFFFLNALLVREAAFLTAAQDLEEQILGTLL